jgi:hypothetical protein
MPTINFDKPSGGTVNDSKDTFSVVNSGAGDALTGSSQAGFAVQTDSAVDEEFHG